MLTLSLALVAALQPVAGELSASVAAQALDRCMTTYAVRLTRTDASDAVIYDQARIGCALLRQELMTAIDREYAPSQAGELRAALEQQARPDFLALLLRIQTDRKRQGTD